MRAVRASGIRRLRGLKNISWLTAYQLEKLSNAMTVSTVEKRAIIFDEKHSPDSAYILLAGVARITCRNRKGQRTLVFMRSEEHTSELQSLPTRRSSDLTRDHFRRETFTRFRVHLAGRSGANHMPQSQGSAYLGVHEIGRAHV